MGRDGTHFFYVNPLEVVPQTVQHNPTLAHIKTQRQKWFGVACCPPNLARILTSMRGSLYALDDDRLYILSHIGSSFEQGGLYVKLMRQGNEYTLTIEGTAREIYLRLPENSTLVGDRYEKREDGYFVIHHAGGKQQYVYTLQPSIRVLHAHPSISALTGKVCVQRGLTTYCVEGIDNSEPLSTLRLPADAVFTEEKADWLEDDLPVLRTAALSVSQKDWEHTLYRSQPGVYESKEITLIPYSQWGNRGEHAAVSGTSHCHLLLQPVFAGDSARDHRLGPHRRLQRIWHFPAPDSAHHETCPGRHGYLCGHVLVE